MTEPSRHTAFEDAQGLIFGTLMCALGLQFLQHAGFITGQTLHVDGGLTL